MSFELKKIGSFVTMGVFLVSSNAFAASLHIKEYGLKLYDTQDNPITQEKTFRVSLWNDFQVKTGDIDIDGSLGMSQQTYGGYQATLNLIPDANGEVDIVTDNLPSFPTTINASNCLMQVEYKDPSAADSTYKVYDPTGITTDIIDRKLLLPLDMAIYTLDAGSQTKSNVFVMDQDNSGGDVTLQFGVTAGEYLRWGASAFKFMISNALQVMGVLEVNGNTLTMDADNTSSGQNVSFVANQGSDSDGEIRYNAATNKWEFQNDGGSYIEVAGTSNTQTFTHKTIDGTNNTFQNIPFTAMASRTKSVGLAPEFAGGVLYADGSNNSGTMNTGYDATNNRNYYIWSTGSSSMQDYDVVLRWQVPEDFVSFTSSPFSFDLKTTTITSSENSIDLSMKDTANSVVTLSPNSALISTNANVWDSISPSITGSPTFTPGEFLTLMFKLSTTTGKTVSLGDVKFNYNGR